jgi:hypothetical protein
MFIGKTQPDPTHLPEEKIAKTFINEVTHWWDGSQIYGSNIETQKRLRSGVDGKMKLTDNGTLPVDKKGLEIVGFQRNWWVGLAMLHNLFIKEHNAICDRLKISYPELAATGLANVTNAFEPWDTSERLSSERHPLREYEPELMPDPWRGDRFRV